MDDRAQPATKGDLLDVEERLDSKLDDKLQGLDNKLQDLKDELIEAIRDSQTEVLRAFYGFSQTVQERFKELDDADGGIKRRMGVLETRVLEIEKRLNIPPSAI